MMSSATTQRAGRAPKDKNKSAQPTHTTPKPAPTEGSKLPDGVVSKIQPTAEQLRIAQIINDANKAEYPELKDKVEKIIEITGLTQDAALVALHDCDNDTDRAAIMLLEGNQDEGKWETSGKKKKNRQPQPKTPEVNGHDPVPPEKEEKEPVENTNRRRDRDQKPREGGYRYRGPPRMNRGGNQGGRNWRNKENEKNERNLQENNNNNRERGDRGDRENRRERNSEGRSRGPRKNFPSGRGRGRGGRSRTFQNRGLQNNDGFPESIDTWTNSTAEKVNMSNAGDSTMTVGNWSDVAVTEEWSEEDWTENLTETKVFTPSAGTQSSAVTGLDIPTATALGQNIDLASFLQKASSSEQSSNTLSSGNSVVQPNPTSLMSQQIVQQNVVPQSQTAFDFNQFAKQAAESIKAAVGVVSVQNNQSAPSMNANSFQSNTSGYQSNYNVNSSSNQHQMQIPHDLQQVIVSQSGFSSTTSMSRDLHSPVVSQQPVSSSVSKTTPTSQHQGALPQRAKPPKARLPPPSKIPESAVVMPDDAVPSLDVQFGALQFGTDSSPFDFTASDNSNTYQDMSQSSNQTSSHVSNQPLSSNMTSQSSYSSALPSSVTMSKDTSAYSLGSHSSPNQNSIAGDLGQSQKVANQDSLLLSQSDHSTVDNVSYVNHRTNQTGSLESPMMNSKADQSAMSSYNSSSHDTGYSSNPYSSQKSVLNSSSIVPSTVSYSTHTSTSMNSGSGDLSSSQSQQSKYQSQVVTAQGQNTSSYGSGSSSYGLQQTAYSGSVSTTSGNTYPSQTGYSSHGAVSYGTNNSGYSSQQQSVYSGSGATTSQSGTMMSTSVSSSKLTNSLTHGVKDSSSLLESQHASSQHSYEVTSTTTSSSVLNASSLAQTSSNHSAQNSSNMNSVLGLVSTSSSTNTTSVLKNSLSASKTVPNIPQNMAPMLGHQYIMGQASLPFYGLQQPVYSYEEMQMLQSKLSTLGLQSPVYSYEDMQMLQSKLSTLGYYDMQYQAPTSMTGRDPGMGSVAYTTDGKYSRAETDASTVATTLSQSQTNTQAHGQAFLNPAAALPPGYGYYFAGGMMTGGIHHYAPPIFPVPPATNTHGATTNTQFQKANAYGSHSYSSGYESLTQAQDYSKGTYGAASQNQVKGVSGSGAVPDLSGYSKTHAAQLAKSYDKPGFHTGTPPPFNLAGSQAAGPLGASSAPYATQFIPVLAHGQHHSTALLHHHMQQDATQPGGTPTAGQRGPQGLGQQKNSNKPNYAYWTNN